MRRHSAFYVVLFGVLLLFTGAAAGQDERDQGIALYREGKFNEAASILERRVAATENDRAAWMFLGGAYVHLGKVAKASGAFERANKTRQVGAPPTYDRSVKVTRKPQARYTAEARRRGSSGNVRIVVEFRSDGKIGFVFPMPSSVDPSLVRQSIDAAKGIEFEPAVKDGKPITVINLVEYAFRTM